MTRKLYKNLHHATPLWVTPDADYFVTICAQSRGQNHFCRPLVGQAVFHAVQSYNQRQLWYCRLALLMPDHIHLLTCFPPDKILSRVIGYWKRSLTRSHAISWQRNFFEHRLRNEENVQQKADYILQNPARAGLATQNQDWPYIWMPSGETSADGTSAATSAKT